MIKSLSIRLANLRLAFPRFALLGLFGALSALLIGSVVATADDEVEEKPEAIIVADDGLNGNFAADVLVLDDLPEEEDDEEEKDADEAADARKDPEHDHEHGDHDHGEAAADEEDVEQEWEGRNFEADEEEAALPAIAIAANGVFVAGNGNQKIEIDEDDPFAEILKKQPQFAAHVQQQRSMVEWTVGGDLTFAARACEATEEERAQMRAAAQPALRRILVQVAKSMRAQFGLGPFINNRKAQSARKQRRECVEEVLTAVYWPEKDDGQEKPTQFVAWEEACKERDAYVFEANSRVFVNALNERLFLDKDQRTALTKSIAEVWKDEWLAYVNIMIHNPEYFPNIPSKALKPHLTEEQYQVWKGMPKTQMGVMAWQNNGTGFFNMGQNQKKNPWFDDKGKKNAKVGGAAQAIRAVRIRAAVAAERAEAADRAVVAEEKEAVSLHDLGVIGTDTGLSVVKQAIKDGADVNEVIDGKVTPLHVAAMNGADKIVDLLLENGADPLCEDKHGRTAAELAAKEGEDEIAKLLKKAEKKAKEDAGKLFDDAPASDDLFE